jgi:ubiquinone biosynthesis protein
MDLFRQLTEAIANQEDRYGLLVTYLPEVFRDVRELLAHEVDFPRERRTLREAAVSYGSIPGVRVPRVIESLSTANITAMTEESGSKITGASTPAPKRASQMLEALVLRPLLSTDRLALFHADPHAGNLFYDDSKRELIILDWALGEHLTIGQRHSLLMLSVLLALEDEEGVSRELELLGAGPGKGSQPIRELVANFLRGGTSRSFGSLSGMRLLDFLAMQGVVFPAQLMLFRKAVFTLDGVLHDIAGPDADLDAFLMTSLVELIAERWTMLFSLEDCVTLQLSWLAFLAKIGTRALVTPWIAQLSSWYGLNQSPAAILSELDTARSR